jgi:RecJ-like exonuclease
MSTPKGTSDKSILPSNGVLSRMRADFESAADIIRVAVASSTPILLRYHGDCDGICAALSIYLSIKWLARKMDWEEYRKKLLVFKNPSAIYELRAVMDDMELVRHMQPPTPPLAVLLDFSVNPESLDSMIALKKANFSILIVDHHPLQSEVLKTATLLVSPWVHGGSSDFSAGFIAGEIAKKINPIDELEELEKIALIGDKSRLLSSHEDELEQKALALDFMASSSDFAESLEVYHSVLKDPKNLSLIYRRAVKKIELVKKEAARYTKLKEFSNGFKLVLLRLDRFRTGEFPGRGKITGEVHDEFDKKLDAPLVTVGYGEQMMHFRANAKAREAGFNANHLIGELKGEMSDAIDSGGGHDVAAGLRVNKGFERMVLDEIIKKIEGIGK